MARLHQNKEISKALEIALARGFRIVPAAGHAFAQILCPETARDAGHRMSVWSTPRSPEGHAKDIMRFMDRCPHWTRPP